jgi:hypothetical protein
MGGTCGMHGGDKQCIQNFQLKPVGREFGVPRHIWEGNTKMGHKGIACEDVDSIYVTQGPVTSSFETVSTPSFL